MLVESLRLTAFRGIQAELPVDLSARLTLLYAPNGTGKTSVCDGIEWLLTGQVRRLATALPNSPTGGVRNLFADRPTSAEARVRFADATVTLRRTSTDGAQELEQKDPVWRPLDHNQLLEWLAPADISGSSTRQQNLNRGDWLRAIRFLEAPTVEILLDDTLEAQTVRGLLFSNLFGVGELQTREQTLRKVRDAMTRPSLLEGEASRLRLEIQETEDALRSAGDRASEPFTAAARQHLKASGRILGTEVADSTDSNEIVSELESLQKSHEGRVERMRSAVLTVTREWDKFQSVTAEISANEDKQATETERLSELRRQHEALLNAIDVSEMAAARASFTEQRLQSLLSEQLAPRVHDALQRWRSVAVNLDTPLDVVALQAADANAIARNNVVIDQCTAFRHCSSRVLEWLRIAGQVKAAEARIAEIRIPSAQEIAQNEEALRAAMERTATLAAAITRLATPLQRLREEARQLLQSLPQEHRCPLCAHDYETTDALNAAIEVGLRGLPAAIESLGSQQKDQESFAAEAAERKRTWDALVAEVARLHETIAEGRAVLITASERLGRLGVELPVLTDPDFLNQFHAAEALLDQRFEKQRQACSQALGYP